MKGKQERSELFKAFQGSIKKKATFEGGKEQLLLLRADLMAIYNYIFETCKEEDFIKMPLSTDKTMAYYIYHLTRIEDITSNTLISGKKQIFFEEGYDKKLNSPITTTGNELSRDELVNFSSNLDIKELKNYSTRVFSNTNVIIKDMTYEASKVKVSQDKKNELLNLNSVSKDENAFWLVDYWCKKTYGGLLLMPFSRHQMLHLEGCLRIMKKINKF